MTSKPQPLKRDFRGAPVETKTFQWDGEDSVGSNTAKKELDQIANRELSEVIARHRKIYFTISAWLAMASRANSQLAL
jgi:hypothetical protein